MGGKRIKVLSVFGTRPEAIKMAPVVARLRECAGEVESRVCVTAQHREMLDDVLRVFSIAPDFDLNAMRPDQSLESLTSAILTNLTSILERERPDWVIVQGDTTTAMAAALASYYRRIRVAHVEAGLRTGDKWQPFPEEVNRRVADIIADLRFAPTEDARRNLLREGCPADTIHVTGNTVIDALQQTAAKPSPVGGELAAWLGRNRVIMVTAHRRENHGAPLMRICSAIEALAQRDDVRVVFPVHPNPNVRDVVHARLGGQKRIRLLPPLDYLTFTHLLKLAWFVLTDSGGLQEEAPALGKPVLVMRDKTERPEAVEAGTARLVGTDSERILAAATELLENTDAYDRMARAVNPFGDGRARERIVQALLNWREG
jgi:UDP-N-acetylglucosamine 2-epimerase (non-hydrolysing)